jgi:sugar (pentulose or hexulose) kinase
MTTVLGLDVGTTSLSVVAVDAGSGRVLVQRLLANEGARYATDAGGRVLAALDLERVREQVVELLSSLVAALPSGSDVTAIGVTGQQHGVALLDSHAGPSRTAITWQDQRTQAPMPGGITYLQAFVERAGGPAAFERMGLTPAAGFMGPSLFWLREQGQLGDSTAHACLIPDAIVSLLTGTAPSTDVTDGGSSALFDITTEDWAWDAIDRLGLARGLFPPVRAAGAPHAPLSSEIAAAIGLPAVPVCVAAGDNQASFAGSVRDPRCGLLVNVGTGGQVSALGDRFARVKGVETRAFFGHRYLYVGAGLFGGRAYAYLRDMFRGVGSDIFGVSADADIYEAMNRLAAQVAPGSDGMVCVPLFTGTRDEPEVRASFAGIGPTNFTPGHLARSLLEGIAEGFHGLYAAMQPVTGTRDTLVGAGNGISRNPVLAEIVARRFAMDLHVAGHVEAAALGAALLAADGTGLLPLDEGMARIKYDRVISPLP